MPHALIIAVLAAFMQIVDFKLAQFSAWVGFAAWASYFAQGSTLKGGLKVIASWVGGVMASIIILELGTLLAKQFGVGIGFPVAIGIVTFCVILFEKVPALDWIPGWFIGAACFFGYNKIAGGNYNTSVPVVLVSCVIGQAFGFVAITLRTLYGKIIS